MISLQEGCLCSMCDKQSRINIIQAMSIRTETLVCITVFTLESQLRMKVVVCVLVVNNEAI